MQIPATALSQTETTPPQTPIVKPPPILTGVIPLPQGPPPTGLQAPLPAPALPIPGADRPLLTSPNLQQLTQYLQDHPLTIQEAVSVALATNRAFASSVEALLKAQGRTGEAQAALQPTLGVGANITEYDAATTAHFGQQSITILNAFNPGLTALASLPIDIAGSLRSAVNQAQFQEVAARIDVNRARNQIVLDVKTAFYNVLRSQAQVNVANDTLNNALSRLSDAQKNYAVGAAPRFDVITATTDVANAQQGVIQAKSQVSLNLAILKNTIGLDIKTPMKITDQNAVEIPPGVAPPAEIAPTPTGGGSGGATSPSSPQTTAGTTPSIRVEDLTPQNQIATPGVVEDPLNLGPEYDKVLQEALQTRPEILEADAGIAAARKGITVARRSSLPTLSFSLGFTASPNAAGFSRKNQGEAILGVNIPVFDGGLARARLREAQADVSTAETNRRQAVDQVGLEVQQAYLTLLQARDRVAVANVGLTQARESARLARVRYNEGVSQATGVSPILELSNAQTSLTQAESNQVNALYDYNNARAQLDKAIGRYSYVANGPGYSAPPSPKTVGKG